MYYHIFVEIHPMVHNLVGFNLSGARTGLSENGVDPIRYDCPDVLGVFSRREKCTVIRCLVPTASSCRGKRETDIHSTQYRAHQ
jgi:hypothetical protein